MFPLCNGFEMQSLQIPIQSNVNNPTIFNQSQLYKIYIYEILGIVKLVYVGFLNVIYTPKMDYIQDSYKMSLTDISAPL